MSKKKTSNANVAYLKKNFNAYQLGKRLLEETNKSRSLHGGYVDLQKVKDLIEAGANIEAYDDGDGFGDVDFSTPLLHAVDGDDIELATILLDAGAKLTASSMSGTPLIVACHRGNLEMAELLLKYNADVNDSHMINYTALMTACYKGDPRIVQFLLSNGADASVRNGQQETAEDIAIRTGHSECAALVKNWLLTKNIQKVSEQIEQGISKRILRDKRHHLKPKPPKA